VADAIKNYTRALTLDSNYPNAAAAANFLATHADRH
jgi:hypothetical protein